MTEGTDRHPWWKGGVLYQVYVRSFADSNGDGVGDLEGVVARLDHLEWLGVDGLWLSPVTPSPDRDWGYDVSDYRSVHPDLGDLETLDRLVSRAGDRGIRVILDLVPNHSSDRHPWFVEATSSRESVHRDWYVWADPGPQGSPPNNWVSVFGGSAWTLHPETGQYFLHNFLPEQPDLNWWNEDVRREFDDIIRFWLDRGIAGFRIDVAHAIVKDRALRDNPPATEDDAPRVQRLGQRQVYNMNRPEVHEVLRRWRRVTDGYGPDRVLLGETWVFELPRLARFYGAEDELHLAFNFTLSLAELDAAEMRRVVEETEGALPGGAWPAWAGSNHDIGRFPTRWCRDRPDRVRCALLLLLTLRGTPVLYSGDEIGMGEVDVPRELLRDTVGIRNWPEDPGRDGGRTPMRWKAGPGAGFTDPGVSPWLPLGPDAPGVAEQRDDPGSVLSLARDLIALRGGRPDLRRGAYRSLPAPEGAWVWQRGEATVVALNLADAGCKVPVPGGRILLGTVREREGERVGSTLRLGPWEGLVLGIGEAGSDGPADGP